MSARAGGMLVAPGTLSYLRARESPELLRNKQLQTKWLGQQLVVSENLVGLGMVLPFHLLLTRVSHTIVRSVSASTRCLIPQDAPRDLSVPRGSGLPDSAEVKVEADTPPRKGVT